MLKKKIQQNRLIRMSESCQRLNVIYGGKICKLGKSFSKRHSSKIKLLSFKSNFEVYFSHPIIYGIRQFHRLLPTSTSEYFVGDDSTVVYDRERCSRETIRIQSDQSVFSSSDES